MKREYACPALLAILATSASFCHAEIGLGIRLDPYANTVYLPIDLSGNFRLEPSVAYYSEKSEYLDPWGSRSTWSSWNVAVGAFRTTSVSENTRIYYGGRAGYFETNTGSETHDEDGMRLAPTLGFEYFFTHSLSIAGEAAIAYTNVNGRAYDDQITSTDSSVILRYMF